MESISFAPLNYDNMDEVSNITKLCFSVPWSRKAFENEIENSVARYVVISFNGKVVAYGGVWIILDEGQITNIAVHPDYWRMNFGSMILKKIIDLCSTEGAYDITLEVRASNVAALKLYKKFGFIEEGLRKRYYEDNNEDAVIMWRRGTKS